MTQIAIGDDYMLALKADGTVVGWGVNDKGELGSGTTDNVFSGAADAALGMNSAVMTPTRVVMDHLFQLDADGNRAYEALGTERKEDQTYGSFLPQGT